MKVSVILPAAGLGTRMGRPQPEKAGTSRKQFMLLDNQPILVHTVRKFVACPLVTEIVVAIRSEDLPWASDLLHAESQISPSEWWKVANRVNSPSRTPWARWRTIRTSSWYMMQCDPLSMYPPSNV